MEFYIREMPNGTATLMTRDELYLFTFRDLDSARRACEDWYRIHGHETREIDNINDGNVSCSVCNQI